MNLFLILAFLFFLGSVTGWVIELLFRRFISSANPERKWINPGFCTGPYLPLYGTGLCLLYLIAMLEPYIHVSGAFQAKTLLFLLMAFCMTAIEYIAGIICLKAGNVRLWDYSGQRGNIQGIICPKFSLIWAVLGALYYFLIHPRILGALHWLAHNLAFSFVIGFFFGVFLIDVIHASSFLSKLRAFAEENNVIVHYEQVKETFRKKREEAKAGYHFFRPFQADRPVSEYLEEWKNSFESRKKHFIQ